MADTYVITNFRYDDTFWALLTEKMLTQQSIPFECESMFQDTPQKESIEVTIEQLANPYRIFSCIGSCKYGSCRLEEEHGTLYLSVV